ncbi:Hypothetical protein SRAE_2000395400 [Strongyloides ratti]|uniref:Uncharacterized protein n=1 Tax=Strongyloides ratti TaxID=34506 RepID=A0A090MZP7_STRRB|nr:Hypothetical protein SRAE_2000395400 [Strongyloides ratti]CEF69304.1 Hypothetical protein SRAE_2000395400 [Strongyloides ratti]
MIIFYILFTIFIYPTLSKLDDVTQIIETLETNSINNTLPYLTLNKIFQKNFLSVGKVLGSLTNEDKNILLKKLFQRDIEVEEILKKFSQNIPIVKKFSSHNSSNTFSNSSTFSHQTLFNGDEFVEKAENDSNIKAITKDLKMKSAFKNLNSNDDLIARYKIPPLLIRANLDNELNIKKQVLKGPNLLAKIRFRTEDSHNKEKNNLKKIDKSISKKKDDGYEIQSIQKILNNNKVVAASELIDIIDKFKTPKKQKNNKNRQKQLFHAPPEIILEESTKQFYNKIYHTNDKNSIYNVKKMNKQNNEINNVSLQDKSRW